MILHFIYVFHKMFCGYYYKNVTFILEVYYFGLAAGYIFIIRINWELSNSPSSVMSMFGYWFWYIFIYRIIYSFVYRKIINVIIYI